jgi:hypothetical protein
MSLFAVVDLWLGGWLDVVVRGEHSLALLDDGSMLLCTV